MNNKIKNGILVLLILCCSFSSIGVFSASAKGVIPARDQSLTVGGGVPTLGSFMLELAERNLNGLWAENLFAYRIENRSWGYVPNIENTASYSTYDQYKGYFIHDYLGGADLYDVQIYDEVAYINNGEIVWFRITGKWWYEATSNGNNCGIYAPFYQLDGFTKIGNPITAENILERHYLQPITIQTCLCSAGINGVQILVGEKIDSPINEVQLLQRTSINFLQYFYQLV